MGTDEEYVDEPQCTSAAALKGSSTCLRVSALCEVSIQWKRLGNWDSYAAVDDSDHKSAAWVRSQIAAGTLAPSQFRSALERVANLDRDAWVDLVLEIAELAEDEASLPRGCVPYLPCSVDNVLRAIDASRIGPEDVFVDIGAGVGRTLALVHLLTGASLVGIEIQQGLVASAQQLMKRLRIERVSLRHADASIMTDAMPSGTVYFLYCPFGQDRLERFLTHLEALRTPFRLCAVDLPIARRAWLSCTLEPTNGLAVYCNQFTN